MTWSENETQNCFQAVDQCSTKAKEKLREMKICEKLSKGSLPISECKYKILEIITNFAS